MNDAVFVVLIFLILFFGMFAYGMGVNTLFCCLFRRQNLFWWGIGACVAEIVFFAYSLVANNYDLILHPHTGNNELFLIFGFATMLQTVIGMIRGILIENGELD